MNSLQALLHAVSQRAVRSDTTEYPPAARFAQSPTEQSLFDFLDALPDADKQTLLTLYAWGHGDFVHHTNAMRWARSYPLSDVPIYLTAKRHLSRNLHHGFVLLQQQDAQKRRERQRNVQEQAREVRKRARQAVARARRVLGFPGTAARSMTQQKNEVLRAQAALLREQSATLRAFHRERRLKPGAGER